MVFRFDPPAPERISGPSFVSQIEAVINELVVAVGGSEVNIDEIRRLAEAAARDAAQAIQDAATALTAANAADQKADQAARSAATAQETADAAQSTADEAVRVAQTAVDTADEAGSAATLARETADKAIAAVADMQSSVDTLTTLVGEMSTHVATLLTYRSDDTLTDINDLVLESGNWLITDAAVANLPSEATGYLTVRTDDRMLHVVHVYTTTGGAAYIRIGTHQLPDENTEDDENEEAAEREVTWTDWTEIGSGGSVDLATADAPGIVQLATQDQVDDGYEPPDGEPARVLTTETFQAAKSRGYQVVAVYTGDGTHTLDWDTPKMIHASGFAALSLNFNGLTSGYTESGATWQVRAEFQDASSVLSFAPVGAPPAGWIVTNDTDVIEISDNGTFSVTGGTAGREVLLALSIIEQQCIAKVLYDSADTGSGDTGGISWLPLEFIVSDAGTSTVRTVMPPDRSTIVYSATDSDGDTSGLSVTISTTHGSTSATIPPEGSAPLDLTPYHNKSVTFTVAGLASGATGASILCKMESG